MPSLVRSPAKNRSGWVPLAVVPVNVTLPETQISPMSLLLLKSMFDDSCPPAKVASPCTVSMAGVAVKSVPPVSSRDPVTVGASWTVTFRVFTVLAIRSPGRGPDPASTVPSAPSIDTRPPPVIAPVTVSDPNTARSTPAAISSVAFPSTTRVRTA